MGRGRDDEGGADGDASLGGLVEEFGPSETVRTQYVIIAFVGFAVGAVVTCVAWLSPEGGGFGNKLAGFIFLALGPVFVRGLRRQEGVGGGLAQFGEFVVTRAGLAHKSRTLAREEVGGAALEDGRVVVKDRAGGKWASELRGFVPDAHVFLALVNGRTDFGF